MPSVLVGEASHAQSTQNKKFAKSLQNLKKEVKYEVHFWYRQTLKFPTSWYYHILRGEWPVMPKIFKISMQYFCNVTRKKWVMKLIFCMLINIEVFYKQILSFLGVCWVCPKYPGKFAISLLYLKIEVRNILIFGVRRPYSHGIISFICQSKDYYTITYD